MLTFLDLVNGYGRTMPRRAPPIPVWHPTYGELGVCTPERGLVPPKRHWASVKAILRDADRATIRRLRWFEDRAPAFAVAGLAAALIRDPLLLPLALGTISNYDGIVEARGSGALQDVWMAMTATQTPVTLSWYDLMAFASWVPMTSPSFTAYTNAGTGGAVTDATSNGSWLTNPQGSNHKYIVSMGLTITSISGFALAMLYDCLWAGTYSLTSNTTITPSASVTVTRYASTTAGNADYAGGNMMTVTLTATLTHTGAPTVTTTYHDQAGAGSKTTISVGPATGPLINRIILNTTHNTATVITSSPFQPLTNSQSSGVTSVDIVTIAGGTVSSGAVTHKIVRPLVIMPFIAANAYIEQDTTLNIGNMMELRNVSQVCGCLGWYTFSAGTTAASMSAFMRTVEG
jgi:hypothetical protein